MESHCYKYIEKVSQFVTNVDSRKNCLIDLIPKIIGNPTFCPFCSTSHYDNIINPSSRLETEFASPGTNYPSEGFKPQFKFTQDVFEIVAVSSRKHPTYTMKDEQNEIICGDFHQKELSKVI